jgi:hypothetical protein
MAGRLDLMEMFGWLASSAPYILVLLAGFIGSIVAMNRYPRPALLVAIGTALLLANAVILTVAQQWGIQLVSRNRGMEEVRVLILVAGFFRSLIAATGIGLILLACFTGRTDESTESRR